MPPSKSPEPPQPYEKTAQWYDAVYAARGRECAREIDRISRHWVNDGRTPGSRRILDAGCGTGGHFDALALHGRVTGVDRSSAMLAVARQHAYERLERGDLRTFSLEESFDLVVSLFGVCGYLADRNELSTAFERLGSHVAPGGSLLVEPPLLEERFQPPREDQVEISWNGTIISRSTTARRVGSHLELEFEWRQRSDDGSSRSPSIERVVREHHRMLLLSE